MTSKSQAKSKDLNDLSEFLKCNFKLHFTQNHRPEIGTEFMQLADRHRVAGLVSAALAQQNFQENFPASDLIRQNTERFLILLSGIVEIAELLTKNSIPFMVLKGPAIAERFYPVASLRHSNDIDLLVPQTRVLEAMKVLRQAGHIQTRPGFEFSPRLFGMIHHKTSGVDFTLDGSQTVVELHWRCVQNEQMLNWTYEDIKENLDLTTVGSTVLPVMKPAFQLVYLSCHGAKHGWFRLKWIVDIHLLLEAMTESEQNEALAIAHASGTKRMLILAAKLSHRFFETKTTLTAETETMPWLETCEEYCVARLQANDEPAEGMVQRVRNIAAYLRYGFALRPSLRYRLSLLSQYAYSLQDIELLGLSRKWLPLYWIAGPLLFASRLLQTKAKLK